MPRVVVASDLQRYTNARELNVAALSYRALVNELEDRFPELPRGLIQKYSLAIDGAVVQKPLLETFHAGSELVFIAKIAGG